MNRRKEMSSDDSSQEFSSDGRSRYNKKNTSRRDQNNVYSSSDDSSNESSQQSHKSAKLTKQRVRELSKNSDRNKKSNRNTCSSYATSDDSSKPSDKSARRKKAMLRNDSSDDSSDDCSQLSQRSDKSNKYKFKKQSFYGSSDESSQRSHKSGKSVGNKNRNRILDISSDESSKHSQKSGKNLRSRNSSNQGSAVSIYRGNRAKTSRLRKVLDQPGIRDLPIVIIPVAGEFRTGKSFLLSYFLRYLTTKSLGDEDEELIGFDHKYDTQSVTQGINIWDQPLIVKGQNEDGEKQEIVVLLIDSQGVFSVGDEEEATRNFALTTMISSILTFNLMSQLNESVLHHLELFTAYAKQASNDDARTQPFQKLFLLIRDWKKRDIHPFGLAGGKAYLKTYFKDRKRKKNLEQNFQDIECFLMPVPGECVESKRYNGRLRELKEKFKTNLEDVTKYLLSPTHLMQNVKKVTGVPITAGQFCTYFERCTSLLSGVNWKQPQSMVEMNAIFNCELAKRDALVVYKYQMDQNMDAKVLLDEEKLEKKHKKAHKKSLKAYNEKASFAAKNDEDCFEDYEEKLMKKLKKEYRNYKDKMKTEIEKKKEEEQTKQTDVIAEVKAEYNSYMEKATSSFISKKTESFMNEEELQAINKDSQTEALDKYKEKWKDNYFIFPETYKDTKKKIIKEMEADYRKFERQQHMIKQTLAMNKAKEEYNTYMEKETSSFISSRAETVMDHMELQSINQIATQEAKNKFAEISKMDSILFPDIYSRNMHKLDEDLKEEFPRYEKKLEVQRAKRKKEEEENQVAAMEEALNMYKVCMENETGTFISKISQSFMDEEELGDIYKTAKKDALKKYQDLCKDNSMLSKDQYSDNEKNLIKEMEKEYTNHQKRLIKEREIKRNKENEKQTTAIKESKDEYNAYMAQETASFMSKRSNSFMDEEELKSINEIAIAEAVQKYEDLCSSDGTLFPDMFTDNKNKLLQIVKREYPKYEKELNTQRNKKKLQELQDQIQAIEDAMKEYNLDMKNETGSFKSKITESFMDEEEVQNINEICKDKAIKKYEDMCKDKCIISIDSYKQNEMKLIKNLQEALSNHMKRRKDEEERKRQQEHHHQTELQKKAMEIYNCFVEQHTVTFISKITKSFMDEDELQTIDDEAKTEAMQHYEDTCLKEGFLFEEIYTANKHKLEQELDEKYLKYKKQLQNEKERMRQQNKINQERAIEKLLKEYTGHMDDKTAEKKNYINKITKKFMTQEDLLAISKSAITRKESKFDDICKTDGIIFKDIYNKSKETLVKMLNEKYRVYEDGLFAAKERQKPHESINQLSAIKEARKTYRNFMDNKEEITDMDILSCEDEKARIEAKKRYEDICKADGILFEDLYKENMETLIEELNEDLKKYKDKVNTYLETVELEKKYGMDLELEKRRRENMAEAIGIDLGTTFSCAAVLLQDQSIEIIAVDQDKRIMPSYVAFTETQNLIGLAAKDQLPYNSANTIFDVKRLMGRKLNDPNVEKHRNHWPFKLEEDKNRAGIPKYHVEYLCEQITQAPEEISAKILKKLKEAAEKFLRARVTDAVITVPAYFNDSQRQATIDAAKIADLNVLRIINEPTAAAICYGLGQKDNKKVLVFDFGGGTFDVSIMHIKEGVFEVKATNGITDLGGRDFDNRLLDHFTKEFMSNYDMHLNDLAKNLLLAECEKVKILLSTNIEATINIPSLCENIDFRSKINRAKFNKLCADLFERTLGPVKQTLKDAKMDKSEIDDIVLVGGSTHIPEVKKTIQDFFNGKELNATKNAVEAVAEGAAIQAAILSGYQYVKNYSLVDVTPLSLGVRTADGGMSVVIKKNTKIPAKKTRCGYTTDEDFQESVVINIFEGEYPMANENHKLGDFELKVPEGKREGEPEIEITFDVDENGTLHVSAVEKSSGEPVNITIDSNKGRLNADEIAKMKLHAEENKNDN